jgi:glycosyltransferase involved in cell wall biosynthesis
MKLSIIMPAYNEAATIEEIVVRVLQSPEDLELIVVDDGSTDDTAVIVKRIAAQDGRVNVVQHETNRGKGAAVRSGLAVARGEVVVIQDADLEYDPSDYPSLLRPLERDDADAVFGSRYLGPHSSVPLHYYACNKFITWWCNILYGTSLSDVLTGCKAFRRRCIAAEELRSSGFAIEVELLARLARKGARLFEVPVYYAARRAGQGKKIRWWDAFRIVAAAVWLRWLG